MQRIVESVYPIIDEYWRNAELIAQCCFIEPSNVFDVARADAERDYELAKLTHSPPDVSTESGLPDPVLVHMNTR